MTNLLEKLGAALLERVCKNYITSVIGILVIAAGAIGGAAQGVPAALLLGGVRVQSALEFAATVIGGIALLLAKDKGISVKLPKVGILLLAVALPSLWAPPVQAETPPAPVANLYGVGVSYNAGATPEIAGTGLYAHQLNANGTYAFTAVDALPNTLKPFTVTTNLGVGVAQKVATIGGVPIYMPTAAGISFSGVNTGWQWNTGALAAIHLKGHYYLMPQLRLVKSSVSGGTGYQPIVGLLLGWGQ